MDDTRKIESTATLLRRVQSGDNSARERLCAIYLPVLRRWAQGQMPRNNRDLVDTNDLTQITLMRVLGHLDRFESRHEGAFLCYLRETLISAIRDEIRRSARRGGGAHDDLEVLDWNTAVSEAVGAETMAQYEQALARLDAEDREAVLLRFEFGFSFAEIAAATEKPSPDAARMAVKRALAALADLFV
jgi:RNA polymerase sigma factor (sigma-70 family)